LAAATPGGISLQLAHAEAAGGGLPAVVTPAPATPEAARTLPRTGNRFPWLPLVGAGLATTAYLTRRYALGRR
jgi:LPXTG-motif cell wall-anchored protein